MSEPAVVSDDDPANTPLLPIWDWGVDFYGFNNNELAESVAKNLLSAIHELANAGFDLRTLDGITVAFDYEKALQEIDRGIKITKPLTPTNENGLEGAAMAVGILKDGKVRTRLVFRAWIPWLLQSEKEEEQLLAFGLIAHEASHVALGAKFYERFQGVFGKPSALTDVHPAIEIRAHRMWDEYGATRMSGYIDPKASTSYEKNISTLAELAEANRTEKIIAYRTHGNHGQLLSELEGFYGTILTSVSYLLGHLDSVEGELSNLSHTVIAIESIAGFSQLVEEMHAELRTLWDTQDTWPSQTVFLPLCAIQLRLLKLAGMTLESSNGNWRIRVPFTTETMPINYYCSECGKTYYQSKPLLTSPCHGALSCPIPYPIANIAPPPKPNASKEG